MVKGQTIKWSNGQSGGDGTRWIADRLAVVAVLTTCFLFSLFALAAAGCKNEPCRNGRNGQNGQNGQDGRNGQNGWSGSRWAGPRKR